MGQPVAVVEKQSATPGIVRFELNRSVTGQGHDHYASRDEAVGSRPSTELARRLFDTGKVAGVHMFSNIVTVDLRKGFSTDGLRHIVEDLYLYYYEGFVPPVLEMPAGEAPSGDATGAPVGGGGATDAAPSRVPADLLERSRLAKEKWMASKAGA